MFLGREGKPGESLFEPLSRQKVSREGREGREDRLCSNLLIPFAGFITFYGSSLFSVGEVNQEVKIWNSGTQEIEAGKDVCRTTEEITTEHSRLRNTGSVIDRQGSRRRELSADWRAGVPLKLFHPATYYIDSTSHHSFLSS
jgi:hypothetical protein